MPWLTQELKQLATKRLEELYLKVSFGKHVNEIDEFSSSSIESRVEDLHDAFRDPTIKLVITVIGGFNSNQLLRYLDYGMIKKNLKIFCGYSDITALSNAIYAKTGLVTIPARITFLLAINKGLTIRSIASKDAFSLTPRSI